MMRFRPGSGALLLFWTHCALATPPSLFSQPAHESPVRADPGDLLLLPGYGFSAGDTVVYQAIADTTQPLPAAPGVPRSSTTSQR
jgi:hypothetical protein